MNPFGPRHEDAREVGNACLITSGVAALISKKNKPITPEKIFPSLGRTQRRQTPQEMMAIARAFATKVIGRDGKEVKKD